MSVALAFVAGYLVARLVWVVLQPTFLVPALLKENHRGRRLPTAVGVVLGVTLAGVEAGRVVAGAAGIGGSGGPGPERMAVVVATLGFVALGLFDDVAGSAEHRGFRGHVGAMGHRSRRSPALTTGGLKLFGGVAVSLLTVATAGLGREPSLGRLLLDAALVALAANLANLFDRAPGRLVKVSLVAFLALTLAAGGAVALTGVAVVAGGAGALLLDDLHERLMLGDAGANALGAVLGVGVVVSSGPGARNVVLGVLAALNLTAELVSFSQVIDAVPPLRALDGLGRRTAGRRR